jgi:hypothetical protein
MWMASEPLHRTRRRAIRAAAALLVTASLGWLGACGDNPDVTRIEGPGGQGDIVGRVVFQGLGTPPYPSARVVVAAPSAGVCQSQFTKIQIAGEFTSWDLTLAPAMTKDQECVWIDTLTIQAGTYLFKFVTGGAFDSPPDYGGSENDVLVIPGTYPALPVSGQGTALKISVKTAGEYQIVLNEGTGEFSITPPGAEAGSLIATTDPQTGEFSFIDVGVGLYEVTVTSPGYLTQRLGGIVVRHNREARLGDVSLEVPGGALKGVVLFQGDPRPRPQATVKVFNAGSSTEVQSAETDSAFAFVGLATGSYDVVITATDFAQERRNSVAFTNGQDTDLGAITLAELTGRLSGVVQFADHPGTRPTATVKVRTAGTATVLATAETDSAFAFKGLNSGSFDVVVTAPGYLEGRQNAVTYVKGDILDIGTITLVPGCESAFTKIQVLGDFNAWSLQFPSMTKLPNCAWVDTLTIQPGTYNFKFVTGGAFDSPLDYGGSENETLPLPGTYPVKPVSGQGTALKISVLTGGDYVFRLDESRLEFTATLLGTVPTGGISGTVAFAGLSTGPYPQATVDLYQGTATTPLATVKSNATTRTFGFQTLPNGTYKVEITSPCFVKETRTGVTVSGANVDLGSITLAAGTSDFTTIQIVGEFTSWDPAEAPQMVQAPSCVWTATLQITADMVGTNKFFKFLTDGAFDDPKDYGGDENTLLTLPGTFPVRPVSGQGTALKVQFPGPGSYVFTLDERRHQIPEPPQ